MEFLMTEATYKLLIILCMIQGTYGVLIHHNESVTAVEGQNVSLPCFVEEENEIKVIQLEWIKQQKENENDQKIVVVHHTMPEHYFQRGFLLTTMISSKTGKLQGSVLTLYKVAMKDSGNYICEITSYPNGSIKRTTKLQVTEPPASVEMSHPYGFIKEGDEVKITCSARPPPLHYTLGRSKDKLLWMKSLNGEFILPNVTRNNSDLYVCLPEWDSFGKNQQGLNTTVELTVNFLDGIECNTSSPLNVSFGEDVAIKCIAKASEYLHYKWMMGDTTLSLSDTLSLTSMTSNQSGTYKLTAVFQDNQLQTDIEFSIHVLSKASEGLTTPSPVGITKHLRNFTSMGISSWNTGAIETTTESGHFLTSTSKPNATMTNLQQPRKTSHGTPLTGSTSAPPVGNASTLHASTVKSAGTSCTQNQSTSQDPLTGRNKVTTVITEKKLTTTVTTSKESKSAAYIAVPIVLLLLVLTALLYRKYLNQKKMDLPPPFKPPPPPVKYTSVRKYDVPMTDILV